jgi:hypothetical protein
MIAYIRKAITGGVAAAVATFVTANADGDITNAEWGGIAGAFIAGAIAVYLVPNRRYTEPDREFVGEQE